jgi:hypothetical protein
VSAVLSGVSFVTGVLAFGFAVTGVGAPVAAVLGAVSLVAGIGSTALDCTTNGMTLSCGVGIVTTGLGGGSAALRSAYNGVREAEKVAEMLDVRLVVADGPMAGADLVNAFGSGGGRGR